MLFISQLKAKTNFQVVGLTWSAIPLCVRTRPGWIRVSGSRTHDMGIYDAWGGFSSSQAIYELPLSEDVLDEVREEMRC